MSIFVAFDEGRVTGPDACPACRGRRWTGRPSRPPVTSGPLRDPYGDGADHYGYCSACEGTGRKSGAS